MCTKILFQCTNINADSPCRLIATDDRILQRVQRREAACQTRGTEDAMNILVVIPGSSITSVTRVTTERQILKSGSGTIQVAKPL